MNVLLVEDNQDHCEIIRGMLDQTGGDPIDITVTHTVGDALALLRSREFACVVLDHSLPDGEGTDILERAEDQLAGTPVVGLSTSRDPSVAIRDFRGGCVEFLDKHDVFRSGDLKPRLLEAVALFRRRQLGSLPVSRSAGAIAREIEDLVASARRDALTGVLNRAAFEDILPQFHADAVARGVGYSVVMVDVDFFKRFNDRFGHPRGDETLAAVAHRLAEGLRPTDLVARYGGEEFVLLLDAVTAGSAWALCQGVRQGIMELAIENPASTVSAWLTVSMGMSLCLPGTGADTVEMVERADRALYRAKASGRNSVCVG